MPALFGFQLIYTAIMVVILQKIIPIFSPGLRLLTGLKRFIIPSESDLKQFATNKQSKQLRIPNDREIELKQHITNRSDVSFLPFFNEIKWLIDFSSISILVFIGTEVHFQLGFSQNAKIHIGSVWCLLVLLLTVVALSKMLRKYIGSKTGEAGIVIMMTCFALIVSMVCLISDKMFDFEMDDTYSEFSKNMKNFYKRHKSGESHYRGPSRIMFNFTLAITTTFLSAILTFPGLKSAQAFSLLYKKNQVTAILNFSLPFIGFMLWLKPVKQVILYPNVSSIASFEDKQLGIQHEPTMTNEQFEVFRIGILMTFGLIKLFTLKKSLQLYLLSPLKQLADLRQEVGFTKATTIQEEVKKVNLACCITAMQYTSPTIFIIFTTCFLQSSSRIQILKKFTSSDDNIIGKMIKSEFLDRRNSWKILMEKVFKIDENILKNNKFIKGVNFREISNIFSPLFYKNTIGYILWFICFYLSITAILGCSFYLKKNEAKSSNEISKKDLKRNVKEKKQA